MEKKISWVIFFLIFFLFCYGAYLWYGFVYHPQWSEEKKRLYENEKGHGTMLNRQKLDEALKNYNLRGENFNRVIGEQKDIFRLNN
ncbi:MAG TPA: hypothetical protein VK255_02655 [Patescibacteria group bacterium]|nr:hypothetical protein [Patescibacteria group bacterium]